jgi:hypothetical protein
MSRPPTTLDVYLMDMYRAVEAGAQHSALALALALPDICGSIEYPAEQKVGMRYKAWCETWGKILAVSGADCYALRCAYLHSGSDEFSGSSALAALFERVQFTVGQGRRRLGVPGVTARCIGGEASGTYPSGDILQGHGDLRGRLAPSARKRPKGSRSDRNADVDAPSRAMTASNPKAATWLPGSFWSSYKVRVTMRVTHAESHISC